MSLRKKEQQRTEAQLAEARAARAETDRVVEAAVERVGLLQGLRVRWARVHDRNNLAHLFEDEWRATH